jgi:hypothetical protein
VFEQPAGAAATASVKFASPAAAQSKGAKSVTVVPPAAMTAAEAAQKAALREAAMARLGGM